MRAQPVPERPLQRPGPGCTGARLGRKLEGGACTVRGPEGLEDWVGWMPGGDRECGCRPGLLSAVGKAKKQKHMCLFLDICSVGSERGRDFPGRGCLGGPGCGPALGWSSYLVDPLVKSRAWGHAAGPKA